MYKYLLRKFIISLLLIIISSIAFFWLIRIIPGSPVGKLVGHENYNEDLKEELTEKYGLNKSIGEQFGIYISNFIKGDFGYSYLSKKPVIDVIGNRIIPTIILVVPSIIISYFFGVYLAIYSRKNEKLDRFLNKVSAFISSFPTYILCLILIYVFAYKLKFFPVVGMSSSRSQLSGLLLILDIIWHAILPILSIIIIDAAYYYRIMKSSIEEEQNKDYCKFLEVNGMSSELITNKYIVKNAIMPTINIFSLSATRIVTGTLYVEILFAWPGMGRLIYESILGRDYLVLSAAFILIVTFISIYMFVIELIYAFIDPRIRVK